MDGSNVLARALLVAACQGNGFNELVMHADDEELSLAACYILGFVADSEGFDGSLLTGHAGSLYEAANMNDAGTLEDAFCEVENFTSILKELTSLYARSVTISGIGTEGAIDTIALMASSE